MNRRAYDIARKKVFYCKDTDTVPKIAKLLETLYINSIIVKDKTSKKIGMITVGDILKLIAKKREVHELTAIDLMSEIVTLNRNVSIDKLSDKFNETKVSRIVLIDKAGRFVGIVRNSSAYKYLAYSKFDKEAQKRFDRLWRRRLY